MTDKQIIIDGVDVSGCNYYLHNIHKSCGVGLVDCKGKDCKFKQLARKTAECEQKEKELKELKRQYKLSCLDCEYKNTKTDADRYREALEEIEELACCIKNFNFGYDELGIGQDITAYAEDILNIINKAKGEVND